MSEAAERAGLHALRNTQDAVARRALREVKGSAHFVVHDWFWLVAVCVIGVTVRLYHVDAPLADNLHAKQTYSSNKARNIARAPFDPMRLSLDLLDDNGKPMQLAEEMPIYITMVGAAFRLWGESVVWGRLISIAGSVLAIVAFFDLVRRAQGRSIARVSSLIFTCMPLFIFYGRAVMPDAWMLATMLGCATAWHRWLEGRKLRWLFLAATSGALAVLFKYWGLMIVVVLADMALEQGGWRAWIRLDFVGLIAGIALPSFLWLVFVFAPAPNPVQNGWVAGQPPSPYLFVQQPHVLLNKTLYAAFFSRFLVRDCGPLTALLAGIGVIASLRGRVPCNVRWLLRWSGMGTLFYLILAPKMIDHDYYELMMLPAVAVWGGVGWEALACFCGSRFHHAQEEMDARSLPHGQRAAFGVCASLLLVTAHSPWILGGMFRLEVGKVALGEALRQTCSPGDRVVALGPSIALIVPVHYSQRAGWAVRATELPSDWPAQLDRWRRQGARVIGIYFDRKTKPEQRASYQPLIDALPVVARGRSGAGDEASYEYVVLGLEPERMATR